MQKRVLELGMATVYDLGPFHGKLKCRALESDWVCLHGQLVLRMYTWYVIDLMIVLPEISVESNPLWHHKNSNELKQQAGCDSEKHVGQSLSTDTDVHESNVHSGHCYISL